VAVYEIIVCFAVVFTAVIMLLIFCKLSRIQTWQETIQNALQHGIVGRDESAAPAPVNDRNLSPVILGNDKVNSLVEISIAKGIDFSSTADDTLSLGQGVIDHLQPLLAHANSLITSAANVKGTFIVVRFAPEIAHGLRNGSLHLMRSLEGGFRLTAVDSTHEIAGHGSIITESHVNLTMVATGIWSILAILTAQKYLLDIGRRLAKIEASVNDIKDWLETDRSAWLVSDLTHVDRWANCLLSQDLSELDVSVIACELESIER
jgi:hypothetical protein